METNVFPFQTLLLIALLAFFIPLAVERLRLLALPVIVAEIIAGMVFGRSGLDLIHPDPVVTFLSTFGFIYLMFLSGLEIDFRLLGAGKKGSGSPALQGGFLFLLTLCFGFLFSLLLYHQGYVRSPWLMALLVSTTSLGVVVPVLKERGLLPTSIGQAVLLGALIADFATMILLTVLVTFIRAAGSWGLFMPFLLLLAVVLSLYRLGRHIPLDFFERLGPATSEVKVRGAFALILFFIAISDLLGVEAILGAFLAGLIISSLSEREGSQLHLKLDGIGYGFFIPIFFINVGATLEVWGLLRDPRSLYLIPLLLVILYAVKVLPSLVVFTRPYGFRKALGAGLLLSSRLSLIIAASTIGQREGLISPSINSAVVILAIITVTVSPLLSGRFLPARAIGHKPLTLFIGAKEINRLLARRLVSRGQKAVLFDDDPERVREAQRNGPDVRPLSAIESLDYEKVKATVVNAGSDGLTLDWSRKAKAMGAGAVYAIVSDNMLMKKLNEIDVKGLSPALSCVSLAETILVNPTRARLLEPEGEIILEEVTVRNPAFTGPLRFLTLPGDCLISVIYRGDEEIVPHGDTVIAPGDTLILIGSAEFVGEARELLGAPDGDADD